MRLLVNSSVSPRPWVRYREASKARPLAVAFVTCYGKGSASDLVAQMVVERMVAQMVEAKHGPKQGRRRRRSGKAFCSLSLSVYIYIYIYTPDINANHHDRDHNSNKNDRQARP